MADRGKAHSPIVSSDLPPFPIAVRKHEIISQHITRMSTPPITDPVKNIYSILVQSNEHLDDPHLFHIRLQQLSYYPSP